MGPIVKWPLGFWSVSMMGGGWGGVPNTDQLPSPTARLQTLSAAVFGFIRGRHVAQRISRSALCFRPGYWGYLVSYCEPACLDSGESSFVSNRVDTTPVCITCRAGSQEVIFCNFWRERHYCRFTAINCQWRVLYFTSNERRFMAITVQHFCRI